MQVVQVSGASVAGALAHDSCSCAVQQSKEALRRLCTGTQGSCSPATRHHEIYVCAPSATPNTTCCSVPSLCKASASACADISLDKQAQRAPMTAAPMLQFTPRLSTYMLYGCLMQDPCALQTLDIFIDPPAADRSWRCGQKRRAFAHRQNTMCQV